MRIRKTVVQDEQMNLIAAASDALSHPVRVEIFKYIHHENLARRPVCNKDLVEKFGLAQSTMSQHMSHLISSGLVDKEDKGTASYYYTNLGLISRYLQGIRDIMNPGH